jgi:hypothetical protein
VGITFPRRRKKANRVQKLTQGQGQEANVTRPQVFLLIFIGFVLGTGYMAFRDYNKRLIEAQRIIKSENEARHRAEITQSAINVMESSMRSLQEVLKLRLWKIGTSKRGGFSMASANAEQTAKIKGNTAMPKFSVGNKVWTPMYGNGEVIQYLHKSEYPVLVRFDDECELLLSNREYFTDDGKEHKAHQHPTLFFRGATYQDGPAPEPSE